MGVRFPTSYTNAFIGPFPAAATETALLTLPPINEPIDNATVFLQWFFSLTPGTTVTSMIFNIRRGTTIAGTIVGAGSWRGVCSAGVNLFYSGWYFDNPGIVAGQQYTLTGQQIGSTGASTFLDGALLAMVL